MERMPTLARLWHLDSLGVVLWTACLFAIMFGVRYVVRMWQLWLFAACCVSPLPFLMAAAAFGGSDTAIALLTAGIGALAVFLAGRCASAWRRMSATLVCLASAGLLAVLVGNRLALAGTVLLVAGVVPVIVTAVMLLGGRVKGTAPTAWSNLPHRSPLSLLTLVAVAAGLLVINPPHARSEDPSPAAADWAQRAGLGAPESFPFITRFVGPDATLVRYTVPAKAGMPTAAVDVITTTRPSALGDFDDMVWYPSSRPLEFQQATSQSMPAGARIIHSNADATTDATAVDWYAVTWVWEAGSAHQRVTVIVNQKLDSEAPPPAPEALTLVDASITPALWLARQQPDSIGKVDPVVIERADDVVGLLLESSGDQAGKEAGV
jgi:hypothetical protein